MRLVRTPGLGIRALRAQIPGLPRNATLAYVRRLRRIRAKRRRRVLRRLQWAVAGAVWAIDGTWLDTPVEGGGRRALVVVELASRRVLALDAVPGERAKDTVRCLTALIAAHGAPLVLKLDNGSAFVSRQVAQCCEAHGITLLHSPVRRPSYNGTCEVSGRWAKARAAAAAAARGGVGARLTQADLDQAVTFVGPMPRIDDDTRGRFRAAVAHELAAVREERGLAQEAELKDHVRRSLTRVATRRALELCHILVIEGREYRRQLCVPGS